MGNGGMGSQGSTVARLERMAQRPIEVARALNGVVMATEWVARVILLLAALLILYYAADRDPPFAVLAVEHAEGRAGEYVTINSKVLRDVSRGCNTEFSRFLFDSRGARFDMGTSRMSAEAIAAMDRQSPSWLSLSVHIPPAVAPGPAKLQTVIHYQCNRVHALWPIELTVEMPFLVLP